MRTLGALLIIFLFVPAAFARINPRALVTAVSDSSFHWGMPAPPQRNYSQGLVERDGVVSGNMKCSIMIVPVNPMIDPGMIKMIPRKQSSGKMPGVPANLWGKLIHPR